MTDKHDIRIEIDETVHPDPPEDEVERITWAHLDTALNVMRAGVARLVLLSARESAKAAGEEFPGEEELLKAITEEGERPARIHDLGISCESVAIALMSTWEHMLNETFETAQFGAQVAGGVAAAEYHANGEEA